MKISIITVCFNSSKTISHTIKSMLIQNYNNIEYIIIDGASKDNTVSIAESYQDKFKEKGISYIIKSEPDKGIYDAMNKGIRLATGDIIGILNSDDYYASNDVLYSVVKSFEENTVETVYGNLLYIKNGKPYRYWKSGHYQTFKLGWMPPHPAFFVRKEIYEKYGLFRLDCGTTADYELMLRLLEKHKVSTIWINKTFTYMEAGGVSGKDINAYKRAHFNDKKSWRVNNLKPLFCTIWLKKLRKLKQFVIPKYIKNEYNINLIHI